MNEVESKIEPPDHLWIQIHDEPFRTIVFIPENWINDPNHWIHKEDQRNIYKFIPEKSKAEIDNVI